MDKLNAKMKMYYFVLLIHTIFGMCFCNDINNNGNCTNKTVTQGQTVIVSFCCRNFEKINKTCQACKPGFTTQGDTPCSPCGPGFYGKKCAGECYCNNTERCDSVNGCVVLDQSQNVPSNYDTELKKTVFSDNTLSASKDVIVYMTCIAVVGMLFVVIGAIWKFKHYVPRLKKRSKNKIATFSPDVNDSESCDMFLTNTNQRTTLYDLIDESRMIRCFDKYGKDSIA